MTGATSYVAMLCLAGFFGATWVASKVGQISGASTVLLEVATGVILGPKVLQLVHPEYSVCAASRFINCELPEDFDDLVDDGASFGTSLDKIAEMDYCPTDLYFDEDDDDEDEDDEDEDDEDDDDDDEDDDDDDDEEDDEDDEEEDDDRRRSVHTKAALDKSKPGMKRRLARAVVKKRLLAKGNTTAVAKVRAVKSRKHRLAKKHRSLKKHRSAKKSRSSKSQTKRRSSKRGRSLTRQSSKTRSLAKRSNQTLTKSQRSHRLAQKVKGHRLAKKAKRSGHKLHKKSSRKHSHKKLARTAQLTHVNSTGRKLRQAAKPRDDDDEEDEDDEEDDEDEDEDEDDEEEEDDEDDEDEDEEDEDEDEEEPEFESYGECLQASCEAYVAERCQYAPDILTLIGQWGVALLFFDRGLQFTADKLKGGTKGGLMSFTGAALALITGAALAVIYGYPLFPDGAAMGVILVPTSFTVALALLSKAGLQNEPIVKTLVSASFVDDFLSLLLFHILFSLRNDEFDGIETILFPAICILLVIIGYGLALKFWPRVLQGTIITEYIKDKSADETFLFIMITMLALWSLTTHFLGSHLWGCFIAGMGFASLAPAEHGRNVWTERTSSLTSWMTRLLFASAVGFSFPLEEFLSPDAFWKGLIMGFGPCILFKAISGLFISDARLVASVAMVSRAEFAFLIAQMANAAELIDNDLYAIALWSLFWANFATPFIFQSAVKAYIQRGARELAWLDVQPREGISLGSVATEGIDLEDSSVVEGQAVAESKRSWGAGGRRLCCLW